MVIDIGAVSLTRQVWFGGVWQEMTEKPFFMSAAEIAEKVESDIRFQRTLEPSDPRHDTMISFSKDRKFMTIYWGGYAYEIEMSRIEKPEDLLWWIHHLSMKGWRNMTPIRISRFIEKVSNRKGWNMYGRND